MGNDNDCELRNHLDIDKSYVLVIDGKEYNVYVEQVGHEFLFGRVAQNKVVMLIDRPGRGTVVKLALPQEKGMIGPGDELLHSEPCVVPSKTLRIRVQIGSIDIIEDPWRPMLGDEVFQADDTVNPEALCRAIPAFGEYYVKGQGFVVSPTLWEKPEAVTVVGATILMEDEDESSSVELGVELGEPGGVQ